MSVVVVVVKNGDDDGKRYKPMHFYPISKRKLQLKIQQKGEGGKVSDCKSEDKEKRKGKAAKDPQRVQVIMSVREVRDDKRVDKHIDHLPGHCPVPRKHPRAAPHSPSRHRCATKLHHCLGHRHGSDGAHGACSVHHLRTRRGGRAHHTACSGQVGRVVGPQEP